MGMAKANVKTDFWHSRRGNLVLGVLSLLIMYIIASRAIQTGSLQQYFLTFLFLGIAINRLMHTVRNQ